MDAEALANLDAQRVAHVVSHWRTTEFVDEHEDSVISVVLEAVEGGTLMTAAQMPEGKVNVPFNPIVINTGSKLVLIDTGYGPNIGPSVGLLPVHLAAAGIDPKAIALQAQAG
jgi:hypothetical protein